MALKKKNPIVDKLTQPQPLLTPAQAGQSKQQPTQEQVQTPTAKEAGINAPTFTRNQDTGRISSITTPDGHVFTGLSPKDLKSILQTSQQKQAELGNAIPQEQATQAREQLQQTQQQQVQGEQLAKQVGNTEGIQTPSLSDQRVDAGEAVTAGFVGGASASATGLIAGAVGVSGASGGLLTVPAITVAGASALYNIRSQAKDLIALNKDTLEQGPKNLNNIINLANIHPELAPELLSQFNMQLALIEQAHANVNQASRSNVNKFVGADGKVELAKFEMFNTPGGQRQRLIERMQISLVAPNPKNVIADTSLIEGTTGQ